MSDPIREAEETIERADKVLAESDQDERDQRFFEDDPEENITIVKEGTNTT